MNPGKKNKQEILKSTNSVKHELVDSSTYPLDFVVILLSHPSLLGCGHKPFQVLQLAIHMNLASSKFTAVSQ